MRQLLLMLLAAGILVTAGTADLGAQTKKKKEQVDKLIATLKTDKFKSDKSSTWILEPSDEPTGISIDDKMAVKAREYLNRVIKDHPGTPWASSAERELAAPIGWKKSER